MDGAQLKFIQRITEPMAPRFLLLGQSHFAEQDAEPLLLAAAAKYGLKDPPNDFRQLFKLPDGDASRAWLAAFADRVAAPVSLDPVADHPWNAVYTSSIYGALNRVFRRGWRSVQPIYSPELTPLDSRSRLNLHISYLFGALGRDEPDETAPLSKRDLILRMPKAVALLSRLPEQLTPLGTLAIDSLNVDDWLTSEQLFPVLMKLGPGQAFLFTASAEQKEDPLLADAAREGRLVFVGASLAETLSEAVELGMLEGEASSFGVEQARSITSGKRTAQVPEHIWNQLARHAWIPDDSVINKPLEELSAERRYVEFRRFLADSAAASNWEAYRRNIPFERDFEKNLYESLKKIMRAGAFASEPVILHGQTGTGKSIALGRVATRLRLERANPVIFIPRGTQRISHADIDAFCQWAEESEFQATVIVWDGMQEVEQYYALHTYLTGRGRKFVLVGSTYRSESVGAGAFIIEAPAALTQQEIPRFREYLSSFEPTLGDALSKLLEERDQSFLVALYRLLPATRSQVRAGLYSEVGAAEVSLKANVQSLKSDVSGSALGAALVRAGLMSSQAAIGGGRTAADGELVTAEQELVGLVMVPGKFGLQIPIEVLVRAVAKVSVSNFHHVFNGVDLFRWTQDGFDNIYVGARHALEAKLIAQSRLGGAANEVAYALRLLACVRPSGAKFDSPEIQFAADLVRNMGPNGPEGSFYQPYYLEIAETLRRLRADRSLEAPRLVLQEASLIRESVVKQLVEIGGAAERLNLLRSASTALEHTITRLPETPRTKRLRAMLLVELASVHGAIAHELVRSSVETDAVLGEYQAAKRFAMQARALQPEDFFPIDVIAWCTKDLLEQGHLDEISKSDLTVSILNTLALCEGDEISTRDKVKLEKRKLEFAILFKDVELQERALKQLTELGSATGIYLMAIAKARALPIGEEAVSSEYLDRCRQAVEYLEENFEAVKRDGRCLFLYVRYWWNLHTGLAFHPSERSTVSLDASQWQVLLDLVQSLQSLDQEFSVPYVAFLQAVALWHLGRFEPAERVWDELQRISDRVTGRKRVTKTLLASDADGNPVVYYGTVSTVDSDDLKGTVFVEGLRQRVAFFARDFGRDEISKGDALGPFHIAFNYIAPTADPPHHFTKAARRPASA